ncbi:suppressor protein SRP40 [Cyclospora cayetanensis]|uniref:Suppressor protein SRP40 n=1 Tax=Cyclospora cayetanensis TaxID=88456 RepID=A0A6P6RRW8_9EIME|nr:suppressor protein SRP40 [Cyclospora cayetanensis]
MELNVYRAAQKDAAKAECQKCMQYGHWTYQCRNRRVYLQRPTRTQILRNPRLKPKHVNADDAPEIPLITDGDWYRDRRLAEQIKQEEVALYKNTKKGAEKRRHSSSSSDSSSSSSSSDSSSSSSSSSDSSSSDSSSSDSSSSDSSSSDSSSSSSDSSSGSSSSSSKASSRASRAVVKKRDPSLPGGEVAAATASAASATGSSGVAPLGGSVALHSGSRVAEEQLLLAVKSEPVDPEVLEQQKQVKRHQQQQHQSPLVKSETEVPRKRLQESSSSGSSSSSSGSSSSSSGSSSSGSSSSSDNESNKRKARRNPKKSRRLCRSNEVSSAVHRTKWEVHHEAKSLEDAMMREKQQQQEYSRGRADEGIFREGRRDRGVERDRRMEMGKSEATREARGRSGDNSYRNRRGSVQEGERDGREYCRRDRGSDRGRERHVETGERRKQLAEIDGRDRREEGGERGERGERDREVVRDSEKCESRDKQRGRGESERVGRGR